MKPLKRKSLISILYQTGQSVEHLAEEYGIATQTIYAGLNCTQRARQTKVDAEARAEQTKIGATVEADRINKITEAETARIKEINKAISESNLNEQMIAYLGIEAFKQVVESDTNTIIMPSNMTELGNVPVIKELWNKTDK